MSRSDGDGQVDSKESKRRGPHGGAVNAVEREQIVDDENEKCSADAGVGSSEGRHPDSGPGHASERGPGEGYGGDQDETLVRVWPAPGTPGSQDGEDEADDPDKRDRCGDRGVKRAKMYSATKRVDAGHHAEHDHNRGKAKGHSAEGTMPLNTASGNESGLHDQQ